MSEPTTAAVAPSGSVPRFCPALRLTELEVVRRDAERGRLEVQVECLWVAPGLQPVTFSSPVFHCRPGETVLPRLLITPPLGVDFVLWTLVVQERDRRAARLGERIPELLSLAPVHGALAAGLAGGGGAALGLAVKAAAAILRHVGRPDLLLSHSAYTYPGMPVAPIELTGPERRAAARAVLVIEPAEGAS